MKWSYRRYAVGKSRICPTGKVFRPEAKLKLSGSRGDTYMRALIDTGADHTIFPFSVATDIGAELYEAEPEEAKGFSGHEIAIIPGRVQIELLGQEETYLWNTIVGFAKFTSSVDECSLLGHAGCLEFFSATFNGLSQVVELTPQKNFPTLV